MSDLHSERINVPAPKSLVDAIDEWRRHQPDIPPRATATRRLIELGLEAAKQQAAEAPSL